ncbi:MAG: tail fiber domain-containing protein [Bacteroidales bacterium]|nr:tail fiber domain-containing protein [Bacteroidales bacterium]
MKKLIFIASMVSLCKLSDAQIKMNSSGNVGIGTTSTTAKLNIGGSSYNSYFYHGSNEDTYIRPGKSSGKVIMDKGNVGIGFASPSRILDVNGSSMRFFYSSNYPIIFDLYHSDPRLCSNNKVVFYKYTSPWNFIDIECKILYESSDSLAKTNLKKIEKSIDKIKEINGYTFNWKTDENGLRHAGLLAQQVERVIPEAVSTSDSTGEKMMAYSHIIPYLVEAIKELSLQVDSLDKVIKEKEKDELKNIEAVPGEDENNEVSLDKPYLEQNIPNPFSEATIINFYLPVETIKASLNVYDMQGLQIKNYKIIEKGNSSVIINGSELKPGMYLYTLIVDNKEIDIKRMILTD